VKYLNQPKFMSAPVDDMVARAHVDGKTELYYAANPVFEWCFGNAHGEKRRDGTLMMYKDSEKSLYKVDTAVACAIANGLRLNPEFSDKVKKKPSIYEKRGLAGW
jgi:phage terminase large subunit-like protein